MCALVVAAAPEVCRIGPSCSRSASVFRRWPMAVLEGPCMQPSQDICHGLPSAVWRCLGAWMARYNVGDVQRDDCGCVCGHDCGHVRCWAFTRTLSDKQQGERTDPAARMGRPFKRVGWVTCWWCLEILVGNDRGHPCCCEHVTCCSCLSSLKAGQT
jgi:hypothetical protein